MGYLSFKTGEATNVSKSCFNSVKKSDLPGSYITVLLRSCDKNMVQQVLKIQVPQR